MSNLLKYRSPMVIHNEEDAVIIDSNNHLEEIVKEKMRQLQQQEEADQKIFVPGIDAAEVDMSDYSEDGGITFEEAEEDSWEEQPEEESSAVPEMDMTAYKEMADEILADANTEAETIISNAKAECVKIRDDAYQEGFNKGMAEATAQAEADFSARRAALDEEKASLEADYQAKVDDIEPQIVNVVADVFEKVFLIQFAEKKEILLNLVRNAVNQIENSKEFLIKVPKENLQFVMEHKEELQEQVGQYVSIEIISDNDLTDNQCVIHTDSGVFDCSLDIQLDNLVRDLKSLSIK